MKYIMLIFFLFVHLGWCSFIKEVGIELSPVLYVDFVSYSGSVNVLWWQATTNFIVGNIFKYQGGLLDVLFLQHFSLLALGRYQFPVGNKIFLIAQIDTGPGYTVGQTASSQRNVFHWFLDMKMGIKGSWFSVGKLPLFVDIGSGYELYWIPFLGNKNLLIRGVPLSLGVSVIF